MEYVLIAHRFYNEGLVGFIIISPSKIIDSH